MPKTLKLLLSRLPLYLVAALMITNFGLGATQLYLASQISLTSSALAELDLAAAIQIEELSLRPFKKLTLTNPAGYTLVTTIDAKEFPFAKVSDTEITLSPKKYDDTVLTLVYKPSNGDELTRIVKKITIAHAPFNAKKLTAAINNYLGDRKDNYGIYLYDFQRDQEFGLNAKKIFPPASISKLPAALLTLRDIDAGKRNYSDTYPIQQQYKHGSEDPLARLVNGTHITVREYLERLILESNNTAQYHLRGLLGGSYEALNPRTEKELRAKPFYENPHIASPRAIGTALRDVYTRTSLSDKSAKFLLNLMQSTPPDLRLAIPSSVPTGTKVANKVGFLFGGREGDVYNDAAIVYGPKTDYVLVVLNNSAPAYPRGAFIVRDIAKLVYEGVES
jgi:beta-lactamase class A